LFTSEDSANLLQYHLFDVALPPQINRKARLCLSHAKKELQQLWQQNVMIKTTICYSYAIPKSTLQPLELESCNCNLPFVISTFDLDG
jgi:hypothetical protein